MNTEKFTGKAESYAKARPGYPDAAMDYIKTLVPPNAVFADIGAGTGKFTELLAKSGYTVFAVEPNADMQEQLSITLAPYQNAKIITGSAEATTLPDHSIDVVTCAQALGWFDLKAFRTECRRIGKSDVLVISLYNVTPGDNHTPGSHRLSSKQAAELFFKNPVVREFPNPILYTRERWLQQNASISDNPQPSDSEYEAHIAEMNAVFDSNNVDGLLRINLVTTVYSEMIIPEALSIMDERFGHDTLISIATIDGNRPAVRTVNSYYEEGSFYTVTYALSNKMKQIQSNPEVAICGEWFTAHGIGENIGYVRDEKNTEIMSKLRTVFAEWYDNGHTDESDPNTCILCVRLTDGVIFSNGTRYDIDFTKNAR